MGAARRRRPLLRPSANQERNVVGLLVTTKINYFRWPRGCSWLSQKKVLH